MGRLFEQIDCQPSPIGEISLRRRRIPALSEEEIYEVKLGEEFLMSSLFVEAEVALAELALVRLEGESLELVVGGLGLGYTARAALKDPRVRQLRVVEYLPPVIDWHRRGLVPLGEALCSDPRCRFQEGDFFALARGSSGFDPDRPGQRVDGILLDIDHSPEALLDDGNAAFYTERGLCRLAEHIKPGGVFALWSNEPPEPRFAQRVASVFEAVRSEPVRFFNPLQNRMACNTVYSALRPA